VCSNAEPINVINSFVVTILFGELHFLSLGFQYGVSCPSGPDVWLKPSVFKLSEFIVWLNKTLDKGERFLIPNNRRVNHTLVPIY